MSSQSAIATDSPPGMRVTSKSAWMLLPPEKTSDFTGRGEKPQHITPMFRTFHSRNCRDKLEPRIRACLKFRGERVDTSASLLNQSSLELCGAFLVFFKDTPRSNSLCHRSTRFAFVRAIVPVFCVSKSLIDGFNRQKTEHSLKNELIEVPYRFDMGCRNGCRVQHHLRAVLRRAYFV